MDESLSKTFDIIRFPLAIMVVFLHIAPVISPYDDFSNIENEQLVYTYLNMCICKVATCAVPCFFFISGYLYFCKINSFTSRIFFAKLKKRAQTLFIPYIIWNIIAVLYLQITNQLLYGFSFSYIFLSPANFPLWFLRNLIILNCITPLFYLAIKHTRWVGLVIISIVFIFSAILWPSLKFIGLSFYFFYAGCIFGIKHVNILSFPVLYKWGGFFLFQVLLICEIVFKGYLAWCVDNLLLVTGVYTLLNAAGYAVRNYNISLPPVVVASTFFIYASHRLGPTYISKKIIGIIPIPFLWRNVVIFIICPFIAISICILGYTILKITAPKLLRFLTGR